MSEDRPNVLWICTDQQRYDTLGCYGNDFVETPNVDGLADRGVRFERAFCQNPVCTPSRASFLTGRYPRTTRCRTNGRPIPESESESLVTRVLAASGYRCGLSGKLHLAPFNAHDDTSTLAEEPARRIEDGYSNFYWSPRAQDPFGNHSPANEYMQWLRERGVEFERTPVEGSEYVETSVAAEHHQTTWCAGRAIDFLTEVREREPDRPWLFSVNIFDPHQPFDPPPEYLDPYLDRLAEIPLPNYVEGELEDKPAGQGPKEASGLFPADEMDDRDHRLLRAAYWAMCDLIDDQVGRILDAVERTGQREETLVVFTSDHGELLGDHGMYTKKSYFYEPSIRVPLVIAGPGVRSGVETDAMVELVDLAPTLLDAAGVDRPPGMQGRSLWPALAGDAPFDGREDVYCEFYADSEPWAGDADTLYTMVRTDRYKLVRSHATDEGELYDLDRDPTETDNRWDDEGYADVRADLLVRLSDRMARTVDPLPAEEGDW